MSLAIFDNEQQIGRSPTPRAAGSTGDSPVPSGDSPDGTEATPQVYRAGPFAKRPAGFRSAEPIRLGAAGDV